MSSTAVDFKPNASSGARNRDAAHFRPDIEGLRGIAVLIVVAFHCGIPGFRGGFVGVDVFFALSGYLITGLLIKEVEKTSRVGLVRFYARRARRLLPASALVLVVTMVAACIVLAPQELSFAARAARATAVYLSNMFFAVNAADYFAPGVESNPMLHTWSLAVEEQFYLFWPLLIILGLQVWKSKRVLVGLLGVLTVISFGACIWLTRERGTFAFYGLPARAWEFGIGGLAALIPRRALRPWSLGWLSLGGLGIAVIFASGFFISSAAGFPGWIAAIPVLGTVLALIAGAEWGVASERRSVFAGPDAFLNSGPLQFLGRLSYSWYLWHWPFLVMASALFPSIGIPGRCVAALLSLGAAWLAFTLVENPIRFQPELVNRPMLCLGMAGAVMVFSLSTAMVSNRVAGHLAANPKMKAIVAAAGDIAKFPREQCVSLDNSPDVKTCTFGAVDSATTVALFGDSHAIQWFNPLLGIADKRGWRVVTLLKSGCPAADISVPGKSEAFVRACNGWRARAIRRTLALRPSLVIAASATTYLDGGRADGGEKVSLEEWREGSRRTFSALSSAGIPVAVMRDSPRPSSDVPSCLARSARHSWYPGGGCEFDKAAALRPAAFAAEQAAARSIHNVRFVDLTDSLCDQKVCWAEKGGFPVYRDDNHLSGRFAGTLAPILETRIVPFIYPLQ